MHRLRGALEAQVSTKCQHFGPLLNRSRRPREHGQAARYIRPVPRIGPDEMEGALAKYRAEATDREDAAWADLFAKLGLTVETLERALDVGAQAGLVVGLMAREAADDRSRSACRAVAESLLRDGGP